MANAGIQDSLCYVDLSAVKCEFKVEAVEIGVGDIYDSSDEDNSLGDPTTEKQKSDSKLTNLPENVGKTDRKKEIEENDQEISADEYENDYDDHFNTVANLHTEEQLILNFNKGVESQEKTTQREKKASYLTREITDCSEELKKVKVIQAPKTIVEQHEFTTLGEKKHICNHCQSAFTELRYLKKHVWNAHRDVVTMYQCPYCPFKAKWSIKSHILLRHKNDNVNWFQCYTCNKKFKLKNHLTKHIYSHLSVAQLGELRNRVRSCPMCEKSFAEPKGLARHIDGVHNKKPQYKPLQCQECDYSCSQYKDFARHIEVQHTSAEQRSTYQCAKCEFTTNFRHKLRKHSKTHDPRFICEKCGFVTLTKQCLLLHMITHETNISEHHLKYRCDKCNYKTYRIYSLRIHKLNHVKPNEIQYFYCYHCNFKAKRKDNLKTHVLRHFKKEDVTLHCFVCDYTTKKRHMLITHIDKHSKAQTKKQAS